MPSAAFVVSLAIEFEGPAASGDGSDSSPSSVAIEAPGLMLSSLRSVSPFSCSPPPGSPTALEQAALKSRAQMDRTSWFRAFMRKTLSE
jgi:hypothetical protein